jgi:hypothetical protein
MTAETPKAAEPKVEAPPSSTENKPNARAYSSSGNVRPADGRFLGDADGDVDAEDLTAQREQEIKDGYARLAEQKQAEEAANQERLESTGYVNPTVAPAEAAKASAPKSAKKS